MRHLIVLFLLLSSLSCSRGYFNTVEVEYNYKEAYDLVHGLKNGTLIVQLPCEKRKVELLTSLYQKEKDSVKKQERKEELENYQVNLARIHEAMVKGVNQFYNFSKVAIVPDTLITEFKSGKRKNIFLNPDFTFKEDMFIDTSQTILYLRNHRDYDQLLIKKPNGASPPNPFPYGSTVPTHELDRIDFDSKPISEDNTSIFKAIITINERLVGFYLNAKSPK